MVARQGTIDAVDRDGRGLRVTFVWHHDRFAHTIQIVDGDRLIPVLASREGSDRDRWPVSPVFQQLSVEDQADRGAVALLVGMAGKSHWSASVESSGVERQLVFDVACRYSLQPTRLGSAYRTMTDARPIDARVARIDMDGRHALVGLDSVDGSAPPTLTIAEGGIDIVVASVGAPATARWRYVVTAE